MRFPVKTPLAARELGGELIIHDQRTGSVHRLNSVAGVVWHLCDGARDPGAIASELASLFGKVPADVASDVDDILVCFAESGLIQWQ